MAIEQDSSDPTGVSGKKSTELERARMRKANSALELRRKSTSWEEIAETLGYPTPRAALVAVERALEAGLSTDESQDFMRQMAGRKLDELLYTIWDKATDAEHPDNLSAVTKARELVLDHAKLFGYIAPTEVAIHNPMAAEIEAFVGKVLADRKPPVEEDDILEDEVVLHEQTPGVFTVPEPEF